MGWWGSRWPTLGQFMTISLGFYEFIETEVVRWIQSEASSRPTRVVSLFSKLSRHRAVLDRNSEVQHP